MLSLLVNRLFLSCECGAVLFMVSSGSVCRQVVWRRSQVQTPTLITLPVSSSSNTHLLFSFLPSSKMSWISQLYLFLLPTPPHSVAIHQRHISPLSAPPSITSMDLMILGILIFSTFFPPSFFKHTAALTVFDRSLAPRSAFLCHAASVEENAYSRVKFLTQEFSVRRAVLAEHW